VDIDFILRLGMSDPYSVLGVSREADDNEIKKAFRKRSLDLHPDRNTDRDTTKDFQELNAAFDKIKTADLRQKHDLDMQFGGGGMPGMRPMGGDDFQDINDVFNMMFGGGMPGMQQGMPGMGPGVRIFHGGIPGMQGMHPMGGMPGMGPGHFFFHQQMAKPPPVIKACDITLEQCYSGCTVSVEIERWNIENHNKVVYKDTINVNIPAGLGDDDVVILRDSGNSIDGQPGRGDIKLTINLKPHPLFEKHGLDLVFKKTLTLKEALCGFAFEIHHLNGKILAINNTTNVTVVSPGFRRVIPQMGFRKEGAVGNLIIEFAVDFPSSLTEAQIDRLKEVL
jgi:DnaJ-class molecular chaperone